MTKNILTADQKKTFCELTKVGVTKDILLDYFNISSKDIDNIFNADKAFCDAYNSAKAECHIAVIRNVYEKATSPDHKHNALAMFYLKSQLGWTEIENVVQTQEIKILRPNFK